LFTTFTATDIFDDASSVARTRDVQRCSDTRSGGGGDGDRGGIARSFCNVAEIIA